MISILLWSQNSFLPINTQLNSSRPSDHHVKLKQTVIVLSTCYLGVGLIEILYHNSRPVCKIIIQIKVRQYQMNSFVKKLWLSLEEIMPLTLQILTNPAIWFFSKRLIMSTQLLSVLILWSCFWSQPIILNFYRTKGAICIRHLVKVLWVVCCRASWCWNFLLQNEQH